MSLSVEFGCELGEGLEHRAVPEDYYFNVPTDNTAQAIWITRHDRLKHMQDIGAPEVIMGSIQDLLRPNKLLPEASKILGNKQAAFAFNDLLNSHAAATELDELVGLTKAKKVSAKDYLEPSEWMAMVISGEDMPPIHYDLAEKFLQKNTPHEARLQMIELHKRALDYAERRLSREKHSLRQEFDDSLNIAVDAGLLPANAIPEGAKQNRLDRLGIKISDPVINSISDYAAHYSAAHNAAYIDARIALDSELLKGSFFHELLHAYSGHLVNVDVLKHPDDERQARLCRIGSVGLHSNRGTNILNEAYTGYATQVLLGNDYDNASLWEAAMKDGAQLSSLVHTYGGSYIRERVLLAGLVVSGIDINTIGAAYFESYTPKTSQPDVPKGERAPARKALDESVARQLGVSSLRLLDTMLSDGEPIITTALSPARVQAVTRQIVNLASMIAA